MTTFYFDYETFLFTPGMLAPPLVCCAYAFDDDVGEILHANFDRRRLEKLLYDVLRDRSVDLVAYNGASMEALATLAWRSEWVGLIHQAFRDGRWKDPFLWEKQKRTAMGDHAEVGNLKTLLDDYMIPNTLNKECRWRVRYGELWDVQVKDWDPEAVEYSLSDLEVRKVHKVQKQRIRPEYLASDALQAEAAYSLALTSAWGFPVDFEAATKLVEQTQARIEEHKQALIAGGLLVPKFEKGVLKFTRKKAPATERLLAAYAAMDREAPRGDLSPTMLMEAYEECGLPVPRLNKKDKIKQQDINAALKAGVKEDLLQGNYSLDEESCVNSRDPLLLSYTRYGQADTLMKKVLRIRRAAEKKKPIQTYYSPIMATCRTSSSQGKDPEPGEAYSAYGAQVQNLPRAGEEYEDENGKKQNEWGARECFVAPNYTDYLLRNPEWMKLKLWSQKKWELLPEEVIVSVDFDAFEMRTWAQCCLEILGYSNLADILNDTRRCPHVEMGCRLYDSGKHYVDSTDWQVAYAWAYGQKKADPKLYKKIRGVAKGPNFGLPGGMGAERLMDYCRLSYGVTLTLEEAQFACKVWRDTYQEAQPYLDHISNDILGGKRGQKGTIVDHRAGFVRGGVGFCDASNGYFQMRAALAAKAAGWALIQEAYENTSSPFYGSRPLAFVHDEWLYAVKRWKLHEAAFRMAEVQVKAAQVFCPEVTLTASPAAFYRWSKVAGDPIFRDGELIPFEESL